MILLNFFAFIATWGGFILSIVSIAITISVLSGKSSNLTDLLVIPGTVLVFVLRSILVKAIKKIENKPVPQDVQDKVRGEVYNDSLTGKYTCQVRENANKVNGTHCYVYGAGLQGVHLSIADDGLHFGPVVYYRGNVSAAIAGNMQSAHPASLLATVAGTHTTAMYIPWSDIAGCQRSVLPGHIINYAKVDFDSSQYFMLSFFNREKDRGEWIGFFVLNTDRKELDSFAARMQDHGIAIAESLEADGTKSDGTVSPDAGA